MTNHLSSYLNQQFLRGQLLIEITTQMITQHPGKNEACELATHKVPMRAASPESTAHWPDSSLLHFVSFRPCLLRHLLKIMLITRVRPVAWKGGVQRDL